MIKVFNCRQDKCSQDDDDSDSDRDCDVNAKQRSLLYSLQRNTHTRIHTVFLSPLGLYSWALRPLLVGERTNEWGKS